MSKEKPGSKRVIVVSNRTVRVMLRALLARFPGKSSPMKWGTVVFAGLLLVGCGQKGALYLTADTPDQKVDSSVQEESKETQTDEEPDSNNKGRN